MIFWILLAASLFVSVLVGGLSKDKGSVWVTAMTGILSLGILVLVTGATSPSKVLASDSETTVSELGEVTYTLDANSTVKDGYELEFIYVDSQGTSKTFSKKVDTVEFTGGFTEITLYERDYSYGSYWVPWGTGAKLTEAVVR